MAVKCLDLLVMMLLMLLNGDWKLGVAEWFAAHEGYFGIMLAPLGKEWLNTLVEFFWSGNQELFYAEVLRTMLVLGLVWPPVVSFGAGWLIDFLYAPIEIGKMSRVTKKKKKTKEKLKIKVKKKISKKVKVKKKT